MFFKTLPHTEFKNNPGITFVKENYLNQRKCLQAFAHKSAINENN